MKTRLGFLLLLMMTGLVSAQSSDHKPQRGESSRAATAKSAISGAQTWRTTGDEGGQSMDDNALRQSGGSIQQAIEKPATESIQGGGSADNIMNQLEKELNKQMKDLR